MTKHELACQRFRLDADATHLRQELLIVAVDGGHELHIHTPETSSLTITSSLQYWK